MGRCQKLDIISVSKMIWKLMLSKNVNNKKHAPKLIFFNEKKIEKDSDNFWRRKLTLKVRNWQFLITWFRAGVDLPKKFSYGKVLFFTQLSYHLMCKMLKKSYTLSSVHIPVANLIFRSLVSHPTMVNCGSSALSTPTTGSSRQYITTSETV